MTTLTPDSKRVSQAVSVFLKDLEALPEESYTQSFGTKTRTVADIVFEVNMVNDHIRLTLRGEELFEWPDGGWIKAPADFASKSDVISAFKSSSAKLLSTVEAFTAEDMLRTVTTEHGEKTFAERCQFVALHLWYHAGQLNFIQTMLGDDGWHWN